MSFDQTMTALAAMANAFDELVTDQMTGRELASIAAEALLNNGFAINATDTIERNKP